MNLDSFSIDQRIKLQGKSPRGENRIMEHGDMWRVKNKWVKGYFPWIEEDSILLESLTDRVTSSWLNLIVDNDLKLI